MNYQEVVELLFSKRPKEVYDTAEVIREISESLGSPAKRIIRLSTSLEPMEKALSL